MYNFATVPDHNATRRPNEPAICFGEERITHQELADRVTALAAGLAQLGIGHGDVVTFVLYNCPEFIETLFAVNRLGAIFLPLNYRLSPAEWQYILNHSETSAIVTELEFQPAIDQIADEVPTLQHRLLAGEPDTNAWTSIHALIDTNRAATVPMAPVGEDDLQRLMYTSGTTSRPKGVCLSHGNVIWKILGHLVEFGITAADTTLVCGPLYHVGGLDLPGLGTLYAGGSLIILRKFDAEQVLATIDRERPTNIWLAPAMMNAVLQVPNLDDYDTSSIRFIIGGGEKMPEPLVSRIVQAFPHAWFADAYGLTETVSGDTFNDYEHMLSKIGSVGRPVLHLQARILDEQGVEVSQGELGEIAFRGPKVFARYWRDDEATAHAWRHGWFRTGDIGRIDEDGYLYVEDRKKDVIVSGGENIATPEIERVLYEHPDIVEAAVIGIPHQRWGEVPKAHVVLKQDAVLDTGGLYDFCGERLGKFKVPAEIQFVESLPRTPSGKVLKRQLKQTTSQTSEPS